MAAEAVSQGAMAYLVKPFSLEEIRTLFPTAQEKIRLRTLVGEAKRTTAIKDEPLHSVLIDESQFLTKEQVFQLGEVTDQLNIPVLAYGLRTDFQGEPFEGSKYLLSWSDNLKEIKAICHCGTKATMVIRLDEHGKTVTEGSQVEIGGNDRYVSMCRKHFKENFFK